MDLFPNNLPDHTLHILTGPTAVGKSEWALQWAETHGAEIVSCDALLFYRGMDIGTAKPSEIERRRVPHHGIDCVAVDTAFSVGDYQKLATRAIEEIHGRGKRVLVTGGSGFYLKLFYQAVLDPEAAITEAGKAATETIETQGGPAALLAHLQGLNPEGVGSLDTRNPHRVRKALERCLSTGKTLLELQAQFARLPSPFSQFPKYTVLLQRGEQALKARIAQRTEKMLSDGLLEEIQSLIPQGLLQNPRTASAIGYRESIAHLLHGAPPTREALQALINTHTWQLVHKQRTWFRNTIPIDRRQDL